MTNETLKEAMKLYSDCEIIKNVIEETAKTKVVSKDLLLTLDPDTYRLVLSMIRETLRDVLRDKQRKLEEL